MILNKEHVNPTPHFMSSFPSESLPDFLADLKEQGLVIKASEGRLRINGERAVIESHEAELKKRKSEILAHLEGASPSISLHKNRPASLPPSFSQQRLLFLQHMQPESWAYNIPFALKVEGQLDLVVLKQSLENLVQRHEVFRTRFLSENGKMSQEVVPETLLELEIAPDEIDEDELRARARHHATRPFDLTQPPLLRVAVERLSSMRHVILFNIHHLIADAWSLDILLREFSLSYRSFLLGNPPELPTLPIQYSDYALWQRKWLSGPVLDRQLDYWKEQLGGERPSLDLPTDFPRPRLQTFEGDVVHFSIPASTTSDLRTLSQNHSASLFMTLLAAFNLLLRRYSGQNEFLVGSPIANRHHAELEGLIGFFVNTLVLRTRINPQADFLTLLADVRDTTLAAYEHQDLPFEKLVEILQPERDLSRSPLFEVKFQLEQAPKNELSLPGLTLHRLPQAEVAVKHDLALDLYETKHELIGAFVFNTTLFKRETIERLTSHLLTLVHSITQSPTLPVSELAILPDTEKQKCRLAWNTHDLPYQDQACYHHLFETQVTRTPDAIAVTFDDGKQVTQLSYEELNVRANQLAHHLIAHGIGLEKVVAIALPRSPEIVISLLAVLKAGAAYLPLDRKYPEERLRFLLEDSGATALITNQEFPFVTECVRFNLDQLEFTEESPENPDLEVSPDHLAYLIYTSGSSGKPKGALIPHGGLVNLTEDKIRVCKINPGDCVLQFFSFSFDGSVPEFVMSIAAGASLLMAPAESLLPGPIMRDLLVKHGVTHLTMTPSALTALPRHDYSDLRMVLVGGEAPSPELIARWSPGRKFINAYGPTETTVNASMVTCGNGHPIEPTVTPSANKQVYVLDAALQLAPIGVAGELHLGGIGLARGYHQRPALTAERFIPNPFPPQPNRPYNVPLLYKTGDLASYLPDGRIRILGRIDHQTKIRGYRIELPEIERALEEHPDVKTGLVLVKESSRGNKRLVAYALSESESPSEPSAIKTYLQKKLPAFMLPSSFFWLEKFPLTPNGKLDETALPDVENLRLEKQTAPRTETEKSIVDIFCELLEVEEVSIEENFFELGGHSLLATQLIARIATSFEVELTIVDLFEAESVESLSQLVTQRQHRETLAALTEKPAAPADEEREEFNF